MLHLNGFYGYRPKWELNFGPVYMDCCVDRKMSICWSECNQLATKALLVFCSLTKHNNDVFISFGQGGTSIIFVVNNTSRPIWTLHRLPVKAQVEPYLHTEWQKCFTLINKSRDALGVSVKRWDCFPLELRGEGNEKRGMRLQIWLCF